MSSKNIYLLLILLLAGCGKDGKSHNNSLFDKQWHLKNTGQKLFINEVGKAGVDINLTFPSKFTGKGVNVLVTDTGVDFYHVDLEKNMKPNSFIDFTNAIGLRVLNKYKLEFGESHHGTSVAGIIGSSVNADNHFRGIAPDVKIASANYLSNYKIISIATLLGSEMFIYDFAANNNIKIINESYGSPAFNPGSFYLGPDIHLNNVIKNNIKNAGAGFIIVRSAGNATCSQYYAEKILKAKGYSYWRVNDILETLTPNSFSTLNIDMTEILKAIRPTLSQMDEDKTNPYRIVVAALSANGNIAYYSSIGANIWVTGLSGSESSVRANDGIFHSPISKMEYPEILTTRIAGMPSKGDYSLFDIGFLVENKKLNYTANFNGTSAAAPTVSGVIALMLEANPNLSFRDVKHILVKTSNRDKLTPDPKPYCIKILEKIGNFNPNFSQLWNVNWVQNQAGNVFHNFYGFGLIDADRAIEMARNFHSPFGTNQIEINEKKPENMNVGAGISSTSNLNIGNNLSIEAVQVTPFIEADWPDGLGIVLQSPRGTKSTLLYPGNSLIALENDRKIKNYSYPVKDYSKVDTTSGGVYLSNAFYEERSDGEWKLTLLNSSQHPAKLTGWKIKIIGH
ncbi:S8 family serine peptidase [Fluviispira multicolorata]|uniref:S8 family serine peptidase n=1 Tax=Fluviispira multicolorata TaxID=2654512 RepID=A0A833N516_9BACT|nr:S8 family serine peptidase [Fluviispira multicolorata]KAB8033397.1 S8 family serine peptidase [Fluviispira multicolorata]